MTGVASRKEVNEAAGRNLFAQTLCYSLTRSLFVYHLSLNFDG